MTHFDATEATAASDIASPPPEADLPPVRFLGDERAYWRLMVRGAVLLMFTLGIYRFWLVTDIRRFLWSHSEIDDQTLEYSGTPFELLLGFLFALAVLVPVYGGIFYAALDLGVLGELSGVLGFVLLLFLGNFAIYRARRYRLTRTIYRGVRFKQEGSALRYSVCAVFWWTLIVLTLGLAYPFAQGALERFKMRNTLYGRLPATFTASAWALFFRGFPMWLAVVGPFVLGLALTFNAVNWSAFAGITQLSGEDIVNRIETARIADAIVYLSITIGWGIAAAAILYPAFQAMMLRWWIPGLRFGKLELRARIQTPDIYRAYLRFVWYACIFTLVIGIGVFIGVVIIGYVAYFHGQDVAEIVTTLLLLGGYVAAALGFSTIYQVTVRLALWRIGMNAIEITNIAILDDVPASGRPSSPFGEGLADALNVGGY